MCIVHFKERERIAPGARMDDRVLFIEEVMYESVRGRLGHSNEQDGQCGLARRETKTTKHA